MIEYKYSEILHAVRGKIPFPTRRFLFKGNVCLDTRVLKEGDLYIPLKGDNFDGHDFVPEAFKKGARLCLVDEKHARKFDSWKKEIIIVSDTLRALGRLASFHRRQKKIPVIGITGSCGKTTTKEMTAHLLKTHYKVLKNEGTENNSIGVPKTLLKLTDHDAVVVELGTSAPGEIRHLGRISNPTHGVITMIGNAHLTGLKSVMGVKKEKLSLIDALDEGSVAIINGDDRNIVHPRFGSMKTVRAGFKTVYDHFATHIEYEERSIAFKYQGKIPVRLPMMGRHNVLNALIALAIASELGVPSKKAVLAFKTFQPPKGRVRYQEIRGVHWIDDSYNANPTSLAAAIELFDLYPPEGRKILVLGDMLELGRRSGEYHRDAGAAIARNTFDLVVTVGEMSAQIGKGAIERGFESQRVQTFGSTSEASAFLEKELEATDTVLLKGSRGLKMERILESYSRGGA